MIRIFIPGALVLGFSLVCHAQPPAAPAEPAPAPPADPAKIVEDGNYALGFQKGLELGRYGITAADVSRDGFINGLLEGLKGNDASADMAKLGSSLEEFGKLVEAREKTLATANLEKNQKFLAENGKRPGINTSPTGLQYEVLAKGGDIKFVPPAEGQPAGKQFVVKFTGTLLDGTVFEKSPAEEPAIMALDQGLFPGLREALTNMTVGARWKLYLPSALAFGENRLNAKLGPNETLVFEIELVKIEDAPAPAAESGLPFQLPLQPE